MKKKNPLKLRNSSRLGMRAISISMPDELILKLDSYTQPQERSAYVCHLLKQHFSKMEEDDPRYRLKKAIDELEEKKAIYNRQFMEGKRMMNLLERKAEIELEELVREIERLKLEAEDKMKELIEE